MLSVHLLSIMCVAGVFGTGVHSLLHNQCLVHTRSEAVLMQSKKMWLFLHGACFRGQQCCKRSSVFIRNDFEVSKFDKAMVSFFFSISRVYIF